MRAALLQEYLTQDGGAEVVYRELAGLLPDADLFAFFASDPDREARLLGGRRIKESWAAPLARRLPDYRVLFPLFPRLARSFRLKGYDLVVSSSFSLAKAVRLRPGQVHVCYCHTPPRWLWDMSDSYVQAMRGGALSKRAARLLMKPLRKADLRAGRRVDLFVANSEFVRSRIQRIYGKDAVVIHPPVDVERFRLGTARQDSYFTLSRLVPYKNVEFLVRAFREMPERRLVIGGGGPELAHLRSIAPPNVELLGRIPDDEVARRMAQARAFVFAAEEDFGIAPVEAQAAGTPVVAYGRGGALETVVEGETGVFFRELSTGSLREALVRLDGLSLSPQRIRDHARRFSREAFRQRMGDLLRQVEAGVLPAKVVGKVAA
ncbi:MAG TPA: glycosyltransferase [Candidatus Thermoplasmatota archaeon]|nr:glycosyltransferase [Candidatus Thermoplasmatota archaeon]